LPPASGTPKSPARDQTGVYADHAENLEAGAGMTQEMDTLQIMYTTKIIFVV
jgi:hypothetical protein